MTLLITVFAALFASIIWMYKDVKNEKKVGTLALMYWGASIMWFVDAIFEYIELRDAYFHPAGADMINDGFLGFSVVAFGMMIWFVMVIVRRLKACV